MPLPIFQAIAQVVTAKDWSLLQTNWSALLNPLLSRKQNQSNILDNVTLTTGTNTVNHLLGRKLAGWKVILQDGAASLYDGQSTNQTPELTLILNASAGVTVSLEVF